MTFEKPRDVRYVDMCIYIDEHAYEENHNTELIYKYLYHIMYMLASKNNLFTKSKYYDPFAIYAATRLYLRIKHKDQYLLNEDGTPKLKKVKSILNYAKNSLYYLKVDFEQEEYSQKLSRESYDDTPFYTDNAVKSSLDSLHIVDFETIMLDTGKTCKTFLKCIPYPEDSSEWMNIYVSVMLTFMNYVTLRTVNKERIQHLDSTGRLKDHNYNKMYEEERNTDPVLFHLDPSMKDYIVVLTRQLMHVVAKDMAEILQTDSDFEYCLNDLKYNQVINDEEESDRFED